ncbi:hypothetical protein Tharo_0017 [Thauera aromatica K172]|uniref:Uncharacterized protein n=1 Tax=Thauera aromatica K172 TaxID=44139 RepID=A0A2R4BI13_THAAR|nr:hypothetical protein Tharo_0017 [Thauera aromatica K172]
MRARQDTPAIRAGATDGQGTGKGDERRAGGPARSGEGLAQRRRRRGPAVRPQPAAGEGGRVRCGGRGGRSAIGDRDGCAWVQGEVERGEREAFQTGRCEVAAAVLAPDLPGAR